MRIATVSERPDLTERAYELTYDTLREYNQHGDVLNRYWGRLTEELPEFQFHLLDDREEILARARALPVRWDGSIDDLPEGIDGAIARGFDEGDANVLCALLVQIPKDLQSRGLSRVAVEGMLELARRHGLTALIAPVRPSWKEYYPLVPIERYAGWRRADGLLFDPWLRAHDCIVSYADIFYTGETVKRLAAAGGDLAMSYDPDWLALWSRRFADPLSDAEWEEWTGMTYPESGDYWFRGGLATVAIDRDGNRGSYWEPNVWMRHGTA